MKALSARSRAELVREVSERLEALGAGSVWIDLDMEHTYFDAEDDPYATQGELDEFRERLSARWFEVVEVVANLLGEAPQAFKTDDGAFTTSSFCSASFANDGRALEIELEHEDKELPMILFMRFADREGGARDWIDE